MEKMIVALIGLVAGAIGSLVAPWAKWGVEKAKMQFNSRRELLENLRTEVASSEFDINEFKRSLWYSKLYPHLSAPAKKIFEPPTFDLDDLDDIGEYEERDPKVILLKELGELEKRWKLM